VNINAVLAQHLKQARRAAGMSQVQLAYKLQRSQSFVTKVENGHLCLDIAELIKYCRAIDLDPAGLVKNLCDGLLTDGSKRGY
jgi:ribosome-binding protein aMBF1 (putative translation factor)